MSARTESEETYLDWAASTPMRPEALQAMVQAAQDGYGNPTGAHHRARVGRRIVDDARDQVADAVGAEPSEVIFCGSGTEADNLAIFGAHATNNGHVACSAIEHHAVLHPVQHLGGTVLDVDSAGQLDIAQLRSIANDDLAIVSVMLAITRPVSSNDSTRSEPSLTNSHPMHCCIPMRCRPSHGSMLPNLQHQPT